MMEPVDNRETPTVSTEISVAEAVDHWLRRHQNRWKEATLSHFNDTFRPFSQKYGNQPLVEMRRDDIAEWLSFLLGPERNLPQVCEWKLKLMRRFFRYWIDEGLIISNPVQLKRLQPLTPRLKQRYTFSHDQFRALLTRIDDRRDEFFQHWRTACFVGYYTGLRFSDICYLRWIPEDDCGGGTWVDFEREIIVAHPRKLASRNQRLEIPIERELYEHLQWKTANRGMWPDSPWVETMLHSQYIVEGTRKGMVAQFRALCDGLGIKHSFHSFRHGFVTRLVNAGVDPLIIGSMTGQCRRQIQTYAHISHEAKTTALAKAREALHATRLHELQTAVIPSAA